MVRFASLSREGRLILEGCLQIITHECDALSCFDSWAPCLLLLSISFDRIFARLLPRRFPCICACSKQPDLSEQQVSKSSKADYPSTLLAVSHQEQSAPLRAPTAQPYAPAEAVRLAFLFQDANVKLLLSVFRFISNFVLNSSIFLSISPAAYISASNLYVLLTSECIFFQLVHFVSRHLGAIVHILSSVYP